MPPASPKIACPHCGAPMNHHAEKIVYSTGRAPGEAAGPDSGVVPTATLEEFHSCPNCGQTESRRVGSADSDFGLL